MDDPLLLEYMQKMGYSPEDEEEEQHDGEEEEEEEAGVVA